MNRDYAERRIREALIASKGNQAKARQQIIAWAAEDAKLMHELVAPHITGIVAHAMGRVMSMKEAPTPKVPDKVPAGAKDEFGLDLLKAIALGKPAQFGLESGSVPTKKQAASQQHIDAIRAMVSKSKTKK